MIEVVSIGSGLSLQDHGRPGWRRFGVPQGGAMDVRSMDLANALLGNRPGAAVLEITLLGGRLRVLDDVWLALTGADVCRRLKTGTAIPVRAGETLSFDQKSTGLYAYLAVPGGFSADHWFGSASADPRNGMGRVLSKGVVLNARQREPNISTQRVARRIASEPLGHLPENSAHFELYPGAQYETFGAASRKALVCQEWVISPRSDRTGYRLDGNPIEVAESIASEPVLPGSFQVPGNGLPIVTMHDGPTVGGYPKIAVLKADDLDRMAQCAPSTKLTFSWIG